MENDKLDIILDAFEKRLAEKADSKAKVEAAKAKDAKITELEEKVAKLEATPAKGNKAFTIGTSDKYKGYSLRKQYSTFSHLAPENEEVRDAAAKEIIDCVEAYKEKGIFKASMQVGTDSEGGYLVPEIWASEVAMKAALFSASMNNAQLYPWPAGTGELNIPKEATGITVTWAAEEAASSQSEPTVGNLQLTAKRGGFWGSISEELMQDSGYDVVGYITDLAVQAMAQEIDNQVFNGTSFTSSLLTGVTTNEFKVGMTTSAAGAGTALSGITALDLVNMIQTLPASKRIGAKFYMPKEALTYIRTLTTGSAGTPLMDRIAGDQSQTIHGYPVVEVDQISGTDTTDAQDFIIFGNMKNYALGVKLMPNSLEINPWAGTQFKQYQSLFRMYMRADGGVLFEDSFVLLGTAAG